jgi:WD40 repeat protein
MTGPATFLDLLERSHLLSDRQMADVQREVEQSGPSLSPPELAQRLVDRRLLTAWQARHLLAGETLFFLGKYKLLDELGHGGMGAVFKAEQAGIGRVVALKVMAEKLVRDETAVARFHREIRAAAALNDPHVVAAFDADQAQNRHFLVMEYVEGEALDVVLKRERRLPIATACEFVRQAALGLQHAHELGMAHRDIKPGNLLVTRDSSGAPLIKILDLGLARFTSERTTDAELTTTGQVMGTPDYIAPEQARSTRSADIRSDIFSLGCTLFRAVTGRLPYEGESVVEKLMARALAEAPPLRQFCPEAPPALELVVARMLARDPKARYQTPREAAAALAPFCAGNWQAASVSTAMGVAECDSQLITANVLGGPPIEQFLADVSQEALQDASMETSADAPETRLRGAVQHSTQQLGKRPAGRNRRGPANVGGRLWSVAAGAALVGVLAAVWIWQQTGKTRLAIDWPAEERTGARLEIDGLTIRLPKTGPVPVQHGSAGTRHLRFERRGYEPIEADVRLDRSDSQVFRPEWTATPTTARRQEFAELQQEVQAFLKATGTKRPQVSDPQLASLHKRFREIRPKFVQTADEDRCEMLRRQLPFPVDFLRPVDPATESVVIERQLVPEPPRELVATIGDGRLKSPWDANVAAVNGDGTLAASVSPGHPLYLWNLKTGRLLCRPLEYYAGHAAFSPDGRFFAWWNTDILIWSLAENKLQGAVAVGGKSVAGLAWVSDLNLLAWTGADSPEVHLWDVEAGSPRDSLRPPAHVRRVSGLVASRDGRLLAGRLDPARTGIWEVESGRFFDLETGPDAKAMLAFSPDGRDLARALSGEVSIWDLETKKSIRDLPLPAPTCDSIVWPDDGGLRACLLAQGSVSVWNVPEDKGQVLVAPRGKQHSRARLSGDGRRLVTTGAGGEVQVWDAYSGEELQPVAPGLISAAIDPMGDRVALGTRARTIEFRNLATGAAERTVPLDFFPGGIALSPDSRLIAVSPAHHHGVLAQIAILSEDKVPRILTELSQPHPPVFTPDGKLLIAADWEHLAAWSTADFSLQFKRPLPPSIRGYSMAQLAVTSDSRKVVVSAWDDSRGGLIVFNLPDGKQLSAEPFGSITAITATTDSQTVVVNLGRHTQLLKVDQGIFEGSIQTFPDNNVYAMALACSPDGEWLAETSSDGRLAILATAFLGPDRYITLGRREFIAQRVLFTTDGRHVVTLNSNGTLFVLRLREWPP